MNRTPFEMACERTRRNLDAYVDGELPVKAGQEVRRHLETCGTCAVEAETCAALKARVRGAVRAQSAAPELMVRVRDRLRARESRAWWTLGAAGTSKWVMAAAAVAVVCAGAWLSLPGKALPAIADRAAQNVYIQRVSSKIAGVLRPGLADHLHCAIFRRYPADPPSAAAMLDGLGTYRDILPAINAAIPKSWRVVMAHQCTYRGRRFVHVTMRDGRRLVSLVIARKGEGESFSGMEPALTVDGVAVYQASAGGYRIAGFEAGGYLAFVVSDMGSEENLKAISLLTSDMSRILTGNL